MDGREQRSMHGFNSLQNEINAIYHDAAVRMGISDSVQCVLYVICEQGDRCQQIDIHRQTGVSRQTINSAIRKLEAEGVVCMERGVGRNTIVCLTEKGKEFVDETICPLLAIEDEIFDSWPVDELRLYLELTKRYRDELKQRVGDLGRDA